MVDNDCTQFEQVMACIRIKQCGPGRPRTRPELVVADKACSCAKIRPISADAGSRPPCPSASTKSTVSSGEMRDGVGSTARPIAAATSPNAASTGFKHKKTLATRYERHARHYQALVTRACLRLWLPDFADTAIGGQTHGLARPCPTGPPLQLDESVRAEEVAAVAAQPSVVLNALFIDSVLGMAYQSADQFPIAASSHVPALIDEEK